MIKKQSFLSFVLAFALLIPCTFIMAACDDSTEKTKIDTPTAEVTSFVYDSTEKTLVIAENENYTITGNKATNAGSYTATIALNDKENYVWSDETTEDKTISWTITKASIAVPTAEVTTFAYDGTEKTLIAENANYSVIGNKATNAGSYTATIVLNDKENYVWADNTSANKTIAWVITAKTTELTLNATNRQYNGNALEATVTATEGCPLTDIVIEWFAGETPLVSAPTNAGTYTVKASVNANSNYSATPVEKTVTIAPIQLTLNWPTQAEFEAYNGNTGAIYDGQSKLDIIYSILQARGYFNETIVAGEVVKVVNVSVGGNDKNYSVAGFTPKCRLFGTHKENYRLSGETDVNAISDCPISYKIAKRQLTIHWPTQAEFEAANDNTGAIYDGATKTILIGTLIRRDTFYGGDIEGDYVDIIITSGDLSDKINCTEEGFTINYQLNGDDKDNYIIAGETSTDSKVTSPTYHILPKALTITNVAVEDKCFDATTAVTLVTYDCAGILQDDIANVGISATGTYDSVAVGNNIPVTINFTLSGTKASNYSVAPMQTTGKILNGIQFNVGSKYTTGEGIILYGELISGTISTNLTIAIVDVESEQILATAIVQEIQVDSETVTEVNASTTGVIGFLFEAGAFGAEVVAGTTIVTYNTYY